MVRSIERGCRLVTVVDSHDNARVVLQAARGNLETLAPRAIVLAQARVLLDGLEYGRALELLRLHRVDLNLLFDHNPACFTKNVRDFVQRIDSVDRMNLFLSALSERDVTEVGKGDFPLPPWYPKHEQHALSMEVYKKVDHVCKIVRDAMTEIDAEKWLKSILTSYVMESEPALDKALELLHKFETSKRGLVESALEYLVILSSIMSSTFIR